MRSSPSRLSLIARFMSIVVADAGLLAGWACLRMIRTVLGRRGGRLALATSFAAISLVTVWLGRTPAYPQPPWSGVPTIQLQANGMLRFEGRLVKDAEMRSIVERFGVREASVLVDAETASSRVFQVNSLLTTAGVKRMKAEVVGRPSKSGES